MEDISQQILFEDNHLIILNKQVSQIVQGDKTSDIPLSEMIKAYLKIKYNKAGNVFCGVVHRLDRPVSGAVIFAKTGKALTRMNLQLKEHQIKKTYWAISRNAPPKQYDTLRDYIFRNQLQNKSYVVAKEHPDAKYAELDYCLISQSDFYSLLEITLKTGRHHQIRCQLAAIGCPIKGDLKYGFGRSNQLSSISLHARQLQFAHPVTKEQINIIAPVPPDPLWQWFEKQNQ
ncbi:MAG: RluA family pseudouridine synthase [Bacteroidales bacterium]|jgi:23S rRNA pseudouridine1911/1915/1917 synthase|nr:RluA family pseudouridine synthase [Bacteroidales bacterium]